MSAMACPLAATSDCVRRLRARGAILQLAREQVLPASFDRLPRLVVLSPLLRIVELLQRDLIVEQVANGAIKLRRVGALKHHVQIVTVPPVSLGSKLLPHLLVELRPG